jgi:hypothetical protein
VRSGQMQGFLCRRKKGSSAKIGDFDETLIERLVWVEENAQCLIPIMIDIWEVVGCRRSMRRGATTEALNMEVDASLIDANNGCRKFERALGKMPSMSTRHLCTEFLHNFEA